jgi:hypothetical protein
VQSPELQRPLATPEDIGGLLLQAFQVRDDYLKLQERFESLQHTARAEVNTLNADFAAAQDQIRILQNQLGASRKQSMGLLNLLDSDRGRELNAACLGAWRRHVQAQISLRMQVARVAKLWRQGELSMLVCKCLHAWFHEVWQQKTQLCKGRAEMGWSGLSGVVSAETVPPSGGDIYILTTGGSACASRSHQDRYSGLQTPEPLRAPELLRTPEPLSSSQSRTTTANSTPMCSPSLQPCRSVRMSAPAIFNCSPDAPPLPALLSASQETAKQSTARLGSQPALPTLLSSASEVMQSQPAGRSPFVVGTFQEAAHRRPSAPDVITNANVPVPSGMPDVKQLSRLNQPIIKIVK